MLMKILEQEKVDKLKTYNIAIPWHNLNVTSLRVFGIDDSTVPSSGPRGENRSATMSVFSQSLEAFLAHNS